VEYLFFAGGLPMPEPGYNDGEAPPLWVWIVGLFLVILIVAAIQSCN
jgi:hypothetical protein